MKKILIIILCFLMIPGFNVFAKDINRSEIIEEARKWLGTKYALVDGSDGPGEENYVDCSGFVMQVYKKFGIDVGRTVSDQMKVGEYIECAYKEYDKLLPGDILIMNNNGHVGIYTGEGNVIHASYSQQKIVEVPIWNSGGISDGARRIIKTAADDKAVEYDENSMVLTIDETKAYVFGEIKENDVPPVIREGRTMLPARFVSEALGAEISFNQEDNRIEISKGDKDIYIYIGSDRAEIILWDEGNEKREELTTGSVAFIENGRSYTPVRFIAEQLDAKVSWDGKARQVTITLI